MNVLRALIAALAICSVASHLAAVEISPAEMAEAHLWVSAKLVGKVEPRTETGYLLPELKSGTVEKNARQGHTLRVATQPLGRGIHAPSVGTIAVHLPAPAVSFEALAGIDSNDITYYSSLGRGEVQVLIEAGGKQLLTSSHMREGQPAVPLKVELPEAQDFVIQVAGFTKGNEWDQVDLGDARVTLKDGKVLYLDELPIGPVPSNYTTDPPFSFVVDGKKFSDLLNTWKVQRSSRVIDNQQAEHTLIYTNPEGNLQVRLVAIAYSDFPAVDWTLYLKNTGQSDSPIIENIQPIDTRIERNGEGEFVLHHNKGAPASPNDYEPYETPLEKSSTHSFSAKGGRGSNGDFPYFNLAWAGEGRIFAVGWPGQWAGSISRDSLNGTQLRFGQELTHFRLHPGEEVRTPRIVLVFWKGDWRRAQNMWRRWMMAHNMPHPGGKLPPPQMSGNTSREYVEMTEATDRDQMMFIDRYVEERIKPDYFWMDAGWYPNNGSWVNTGTWEYDAKRFPNGIRAVSDHAHAKGVKIILWFEPERVTAGSWLYENHPEWLLQVKADPKDQLYDKNWRLLNLGDPAALRWITDHVNKFITDQGVDLYRQDFNMDPLNYWRENDAPDRQGITEIRYVTGYLAYWDALEHSHPNMMIDSCASGGRRNDIESMRRAVPLTRSDYLLEAGEPISQQMQTMGMAQWIPFFGTGTSGTDPYVFRSQMTPAIITGWDLRRKDVDYDAMRKLIADWQTVAPNYYGDFYPLTSYSLANDTWAVMQFNSAESGQGFIEAFRHSRSPFDSARLKLQGLDPNMTYRLTNLDTKATQEVAGKDLLEKGMEIRLGTAPASALVTYQRVR
jgi:alpha-galactosidase